jgi:hypothetical protein
VSWVAPTAPPTAMTESASAAPIAILWLRFMSESEAAVSKTGLKAL